MPCPKSIVWEFFNKSEKGDVSTVKCKYCNANYKYFGNTTNLKDHLKRKHPVELAEAEAPQNPVESAANNASTDCTLLTPSASASTNSDHQTTTEDNALSDPPAKKVKRMKSCVATEKSEIKCDESVTDERREFERDLVHMIASDCHPLSIVEDRGFKFFVKKYVPLHQLPSQEVLAENVLPEVYQSLSSGLKTILDTVKYLTITTDLWTSNYSRSFITVTAHFVFDFKMCSSVLSTEEIHTDQSALNISQAISNILAKWQISGKVVTVVTDNTPNMKEAVSENLQKSHHTCIAHTLDLSVQGAIKENEELCILLNKCRCLVTYFKQSNLAAYKLKEVKEEMGLPEFQLKQDVPTLWKSAVIMMERLLSIKLPLTAAISSLVIAPGNLDASEWTAINDCVQLLKLFSLMAEDLSREMYPTMSRITPLIRGLEIEIQNIHVTTDIGKRLKSSLAEIFPYRLGFSETAKAVAKATFLDPRFKKAAFRTAENADNAEEWVTEELSEILQCAQSFESSDDAQSPGSSTSAASTPPRSYNDDLWQYFDQKISAMSSTVTPSAMAVKMVKQYLEIPHLGRKKNPLEFWKSQFNTFPHLYTLASKYLSIPATSISADRLFSETGMIAQERRKRLTPERLDELLFISENVELNTK